MPTATRRHRAKSDATLIGPLREIVTGVVDAQRSVEWPNARWANDPVGFAEIILGARLWEFQVEFVEAIRDNRHVSCSGGRKIGKDYAVGVAALWWYATRPAARVFMLAPTAKQLDGILYREIRMMFARSGVCYSCRQAKFEGSPCPHSARLDGRVSKLARGGIKAPDFREIVGATAVSEGGLRGFSGAQILAIEDEASDIEDEFDTALIGNLAGSDTRRVLISNPTRTQGFFYDSHHSQKDMYYTMRVSTEDNPNIKSGAKIPGLADPAWIREREAAWGRGTPLWLANVEGKFTDVRTGALFSPDAIIEAQARNNEPGSDGLLQIGVDVAGESGNGDETAFCARRGDRTLTLYTRLGIGPEVILHEVLALLKQHAELWEFDDVARLPRVVIDGSGLQGVRCYNALNAYRYDYFESHKGAEPFKLIRFRGDEPPKRLADTYRMCRDALFGGLADAVRAGLGLPVDVKLEAELYTLRWVDGERGKLRICHKDEMRDRLGGRSPDRLDALALSTWGDESVASKHVVRGEHEAPQRDESGETEAPDVYENDSFDAGARFDPYR